MLDGGKCVCNLNFGEIQLKKKKRRDVKKNLFEGKQRDVRKLTGSVWMRGCLMLQVGEYEGGGRLRTFFGGDLVMRE